VKTLQHHWVPADTKQNSLAVNELQQLFCSLTLRYYREEGLSGDTSKGIRNEAMLVAQKLK